MSMWADEDVTARVRWPEQNGRQGQVGKRKQRIFVPYGRGFAFFQCFSMLTNRILDSASSACRI